MEQCCETAACSMMVKAVGEGCLGSLVDENMSLINASSWELQSSLLKELLWGVMVLWHSFVVSVKNFQDDGVWNVCGRSSISGWRILPGGYSCDFGRQCDRQY